MPIAVVNKASNIGYGRSSGTEEVNLRDFSAPLISQKETTSYGERVLSVIDFEPTPLVQDLAKKETAFIKLWRGMARNPYVNFAIEDIVTEMLSIDEDTLFPVDIDLSKTKFSKRIQSKIHDEFADLLRKLQFHRKAYTYLRNWFIDGKAYFYIDFGKNPKKGIKQIIELDPVRTKKFVTTKDGKEHISYIYMDIDLSQSLYEISAENIIEVNSGMMDDEHQIWVSELYDAYVPLNQLCGIEDALVIYRMSRAPERRVFYVDVGEMPKSKAEAYMKDLIRNYRNKMEYDRTTGEIKEQVRHSSLLDDIWLPRRSGSQGTSVSTIQGNSSFLQNIDDINYFMRKLFRALKVPYSRFNDESKGIALGRATEIGRDELKYARLISRLRAQFNTLFYTLLKIQCKCKNLLSEKEIVDERENLIFRWNSETMFSEFKNLDILTERMNVLQSVMPYVGRLYSLEWIRTNILRLNDEEIRDIQKQIAAEEKDYVRMGILPAEVSGLDGEMHPVGDVEEPQKDDKEDGEDTGEDDAEKVFNKTHDANGNGYSDKDYEPSYPFPGGNKHSWK